jgi:hypothetical protein
MWKTRSGRGVFQWRGGRPLTCSPAVHGAGIVNRRESSSLPMMVPHADDTSDIDGVDVCTDMAREGATPDPPESQERRRRSVRLFEGSLPPSPDPRHSRCPAGQRVRVGRGCAKSGRNLRGLNPNVEEHAGDSRDGGRDAGRDGQSESVSASVSRQPVVRSAMNAALGT